MLDSLQLTKVTIVGLSLGGEVAIDFAISYPQYVSKLVLASSSLGGYSSTVDWDVHAKEVGIDEAKKNWLNHSVFAPTIANKDVKEKLDKIVNDYSGWHWLNHDSREKLQPTTLTRLNEIKVQTEIIVGANDLSYYHDIAKILNKGISNSHLTIIQNSGHMVNLENPTEFNKVLQAVL
jgi:pimeloyl-ACP methyl ester carboxylesterase